MRTALKSRQVRKQGVVRRLLRRPDIAGFAVALENALIASPSVDALDDATVRRLMTAHKIRGFKQIDDVTRNLIERLALGMRPDDFGRQGERQLQSLAARLEVPDTSVAWAIKSSAERLFQVACEQAIADGTLTTQETEELISLRQRLGLDERDHTAIVLAAAQTYAQQLLERSLADGKLSPQEDTELAGLAQALGVKFDYDQVAHAAIDNARALWRIEHGELNAIPAPINLQRGERCFAWIEAEALELRERTTSIRYGGPAVSVRIMKGVYYRAGAYNVERRRESYHHSLGIGSLCVTSKRLVFSSVARGIAVSWARVLDCVAYSDGIEVRRANGKPLLFLFRGHDPLFVPILNRVLADT